MRRELMSAWIAALRGPDAEARLTAARAIFDAGRVAALRATKVWREDAELALLLAGEPTVGVAVEPETFEAIRLANGAPRLATVPPAQDAREFELVFPEGISLDILTTTEPGGAGAIARFLERRGEGIQQVELPVTDVDRAVTLVRERFFLEPVYPETRAGADGTRVNFFLVSIPAEGGDGPAGQKVLIEMVEASGKRD